MKEERRPIWPWYVLAALLVLVDQGVKLWVRENIPLYETRPLIPHFMELYHTINTGGAFSLLDRHIGLLTAVSAVLTAFLALALWRDWFTSNRFSRLCVTLVLAGAVGNLIDRAAAGQVTDMFNFTFMTFGVFNVADICVVAGVIGYAGYTFSARRDPESAGDSHEADADRPR